MKSRAVFFIPALALIFAVGCTPVVYIETLEPPRSRVEGIRSVAVVTAGHVHDLRKASAARAVGSRLAAALGKSPLYSKVRYKPDYGEVGSSLLDLTFDAYGFLTREECSRIQEALGVDAVVMVVVDGFNTRISRRRSYGSFGVGSYHGHGQIGMTMHDAYDSYIVNGFLSVRFRMVAGGEIIAEPSIPTRRVGERSGWYLSRDEALDMLADQVVEKFVPFIDVVKARRPRALKWGDRDEIERGVDAARDRRWKEAEDIWRATAADYPGNFASFYNLAVCAEVNEDFREALDLYLTARELTGKADSFADEIEQAETSVEAVELIESAGGRHAPSPRRDVKKEEPLERTETGTSEDKSVKRRTVVTPDKPTEKAPKEETRKAEPEKDSPSEPEGDSR